MKTHNELFKAGKKVEAYLMFKKESKVTWSFDSYIKRMKYVYSETHTR